METNKFCQSCSMPLDKKELLGTEKDGSKNNEYCKYCYANGAFTNADLTIGEMKTKVKTEMEKENSPEKMITIALNMLPKLKRWEKKIRIF